MHRPCFTSLATPGNTTDKLAENRKRQRVISKLPKALKSTRRYCLLEVKVPRTCRVASARAATPQQPLDAPGQTTAETGARMTKGSKTGRSQLEAGHKIVY